MSEQQDCAELYAALENLYGDVYRTHLGEIAAEDIYEGSMHDAIKVLKRLQQYRDDALITRAIGQKIQVANTVASTGTT